MGADVYWSNGRDALLQHFSAHTTICRPTSGKFAARSSFPSPEGWNVGTVGRTRKRDGDRPFTICGSVSWTRSEAFCRAICSSLGRQQARLLGKRERENKERGLKQDEWSNRVSCG